MAEAGWTGIYVCLKGGRLRAEARSRQVMNAEYSIRIGAARRAGQAVMTLCDGDAT